MNLNTYLYLKKSIQSWHTVASVAIALLNTSNLVAQAPSSAQKKQIEQWFKQYQNDLNDHKLNASDLLNKHFQNKNGQVEDDLRRTLPSKAFSIGAGLYLKTFKAKGCQVKFENIEISGQFCGKNSIVVKLDKTVTTKLGRVAKVPIQIQLTVEKGRCVIQTSVYSKTPTLLTCKWVAPPAVEPKPPRKEPVPPGNPPVVDCTKCKAKPCDIDRLQAENKRYIDLLKRTQDSLSDARIAMVEFKKDLDTIRKVIIATITKSKTQTENWVQKAIQLKKTFDGFGLGSFVPSQPSQKSVNAAARMAHKNEVLTIWQELRTVESYKKTSDTLLQKIYTFTDRVGNKAQGNSTQLMADLQTIEPKSDTANLLQLDIMDFYIKEIAALSSEGGGGSTNLYMPTWLQLASDLLQSKDPQLVSSVKERIRKVCLIDKLQQSEEHNMKKAEIAFKAAKEKYNNGEYSDALELYLKFEDWMDDPEIDAKNRLQAKFYYANILLWNYGGFKEQKKLYNGNPAIVINRLPRYAQELLDEVITQGNGVIQRKKDEDNKKKPSPSTGRVPKGKVKERVWKREELKELDNWVSEATLSLSKYAERSHTELPKQSIPKKPPLERELTEADVSAIIRAAQVSLAKFNTVN